MQAASSRCKDVVRLFVCWFAFAPPRWVCGVREHVSSTCLYACCHFWYWYYSFLLQGSSLWETQAALSGTIRGVRGQQFLPDLRVQGFRTLPGMLHHPAHLQPSPAYCVVLCEPVVFGCACTTAVWFCCCRCRLLHICWGNQPWGSCCTNPCGCDAVCRAQQQRLL